MPATAKMAPEAHAAAVAEEASKGAASGEEFVPGPFEDGPFDGDEHDFENLVKAKPLVLANFYAPWCYWSNKLTPDWLATQKRLHQRAYSQSVAFVRVDCTTSKGRSLCQHQSVHAFPSIRVYRGTVHAYEPYEYGREDNLLWLHLVKLAAEVVISTLKELPSDERRPFTLQVSHVSQDLKLIMERREQGLDEDWSEDALSAEEEVEEDGALLKSIDDAVRAIMGAKGVKPHEVPLLGTLAGDVAEKAVLQERSSDMVLGLITNERKDDDDAVMEAWPGSNAQEGCILFGFVDVSRAPGTVHVAPHSSRHSFDFSHVNVSHHIDHLSFGLELPASARLRLPDAVQRKLLGLDGTSFTSNAAHATLEHHVNVMPTTFTSSWFTTPVETYQFTSTSHSRTKDALPSLIISYDVSPIQVRITAAHQPVSGFIVNLCAVIGGAFAIFGILDGIVFEGGNVVRKKLQMGKQF